MNGSATTNTTVTIAIAAMPIERKGFSSMSMKYTRFHPDYCDVGKYFDRVSESFGIAGPTGYKSGYTPPETTDKQIAETP